MLFNLDTQILQELNKLAVDSPWWSTFSLFISGNNLVKCGGFMIAIWWLWFRDETAAVSQRNRQILLGILVGSLVGMFTTRLLTHVLPFRTRPLYTTELHLISPVAQLANLDARTSFPSDHATLFFALSTGFFFLSRWLGALAVLYTLLLICFPRVFLGYHYPSDILAGAVVGIVAALVANAPRIRQAFYQPLVRWQHRYPSWFYVGLFLLTYQMNNMFNDVRALLSYVLSSAL